MPGFTDREMQLYREYSQTASATELNLWADPTLLNEKGQFTHPDKYAQGSNWGRAKYLYQVAKNNGCQLAADGSSLTIFDINGNSCYTLEADDISLFQEARDFFESAS